MELRAIPVRAYMCVCVKQTASVGFSRRSGPAVGQLFLFKAFCFVAKSFSGGLHTGIKALVDINSNRKCTGYC